LKEKGKGKGKGKGKVVAINELEFGSKNKFVKNQ